MMGIRKRLFALFMAVILLLPAYIAFADEPPPDFADGDAIAVGQINEDTDNDDDTREDEDSPETSGEDGKQCGGIRPRPYNVNTADFVGSQEEFEEWLAGHTDKNNNFTGGSVILGANAVLKRHISLSGSLRIDTGAYGLTMDGGSVSAGGFSITGDGVDVPVLTIVDMGLWFDAWDSILPCYNVTALGRDGIGGVAVRVSTDENGSPGNLELQGGIRSEGEGAVGVEFEYPVKAHYLSVSVAGENSAAIKAPDGANFYYCKLEASGEGSKIVSGDDILLDTCAISGNSGRADVLNRKIAALSGNSLYWPLTQDQAINGSGLYRTFYYNTVPLNFLLSGDGSHPSEVRWIPVQWDQDAMDGLDTSVIGKTVISGEPYEHYQGLGLEDDFSLDLIIDVMESGKPCIISLKFNGYYDANNDYVRYVYFQTSDLYGEWFEPEDGNFILWRSDGEDEDWYDFTDSPDVSLTEGGIIYYYDEITSPIRFCIQEIGGEYSNIAEIYGYEGKTFGSLGGDRTGVDRGGEDAVTAPNPKPGSTPEPEPTPTPEPASSSRDASASSRSSSPSSASSSPYAPPDTDVQASAELTGKLVQAEKTPAVDTGGSVFTPANELENDTTTAISGRRLQMMMNAGDKVTFIKNELRLSFDTSSLETLGIVDSQLFSVAVVHLEQLKYTVTAAIDGTELRDLPCAATLDGNRRDILVSGTYDFAQAADEPDIVQTQAHAIVTQPFREQGEVETANRLDGKEENQSARAAAVFVLLGTGCAAGAVVLIRYRVKRYGR